MRVPTLAVSFVLVFGAAPACDAGEEIRVEGTASHGPVELLADIQVRFVAEDDSQREFVAGTGPDGRFVLRDVPPGTYEVFLGDESTGSIRLSNPTEHVSFNGYSWIRPEVSGWIEPAWNGREPVSVSLVDSADPVATAPVEDNRFRLPVPRPGGYRLRVVFDEGDPVEFDVELGSGIEELRVTSEGVERRPQIGGYLPDGASIAWTNLDTGAEISMSVAGEYRIDTSGLYTYSLRTRDGAEFTGLVAAHAEYPLWFEVEETGLFLGGGEMAAPGGRDEEESRRFPWPPPRASAMHILSAELVVDDEATLGGVASRMVSALEHAGYGRWSFFEVPDGFALAAQLERIDDTGTPFEGVRRWVSEVEPPSLLELIRDLRLLFRSDPGFFRVVVFIVTPHAFAQGEAAESEEARAWPTEGWNVLPEWLAQLPFTESTVCTALVYEFEQKTRDHGLEFREPPLGISGRQHLRRAGILDSLVGVP